MTEEEPTPEKVYEQIHEVSDCIVKHFWITHVLLLEGVEAAVQKGEDPAELIAIHSDLTELARKTLSLLIPDKECLAKIPELWQAIGWLNGAEEHMLDKHQKFTLTQKPYHQVESFINALPTVMHATRTIRRNLERELFKSMVAKSTQVSP